MLRINTSFSISVGRSTHDLYNTSKSLSSSLGRWRVERIVRTPVASPLAGWLTRVRRAPFQPCPHCYVRIVARKATLVQSAPFRNAHRSESQMNRCLPTPSIHGEARHEEQNMASAIVAILIQVRTRACVNTCAPISSCSVSMVPRCLDISRDESPRDPDGQLNPGSYDSYRSVHPSPPALKAGLPASGPQGSRPRDGYAISIIYRLISVIL